MIIRHVYAERDRLVCTNCKDWWPVDKLDHVDLSKVEHRCGVEEWVVPPSPVISSPRKGRSP